MTDLPLRLTARSTAVVAGEVIEHIEDDGLRAVRSGARASTERRARALRSRPSGVVRRERPLGRTREAVHHRDLARARRLRAAGLRLDRVRPWGFPMSALYHRFVYDKRASELAESSPPPRPRWPFSVRRSR